MKLSDAIEKFSRYLGLTLKQQTCDNYIAYARSFGLFMHNADIEDITIDDITEWFLTMQEFNVGNSSMIGRALAIKKLLVYYKKLGTEVLNPELVPVPKREYVQANVATEDDYEKLLYQLTVCSKTSKSKRILCIRDRALIMLLHDTGARISELLSITLDNVYEKKAIIKTAKTKGRKPFREVYWTTKTQTALAVWLKERNKLMKDKDDKELLFIQCRGNYIGLPLKNTSIAAMLRKLSQKAGIPTVNAHSFRHRIGHELAKNGANNAIISNILGHSEMKSSYIYTQLNDAEKEGIYRKLIGK